MEKGVRPTVIPLPIINQAIRIAKIAATARKDPNIAIGHDGNKWRFLPECAWQKPESVPSFPRLAIVTPNGEVRYENHN
jgi:hypothetical protein